MGLYSTGNSYASGGTWQASFGISPSIYPYTIMGWIKDETGGGIGGTLFGMGGGTTNSMRSVQCSGYSALAGEISDDGTHTTATVASGISSGWLPIVGIFNASNSRTVYGPNGTTATDTGQVYGATFNVIAIGDAASSGYSYTPASNQALAECAIWASALGPAEIAALQSGVNPLRVQPGNLVCYFPLRGDLRDLGPLKLSLSGPQPTWSEHPPVQLPPRKYIYRTNVSSSTTLTGIAATSTVGSLIANPRTSLGGLSSTSAVGTLAEQISDTSTLTGISSASTLGTLPSQVAPTLAGVSSVSSLGLLVVQDTSSTGIVFSFATPGTVTAGYAASITGASSTSSVGTLSESVYSGPQLTGIAATSSAGSVSISVSDSYALTSISAASTAQPLTPSISDTGSVTGVSVASTAVALMGAEGPQLTGVSSASNAGSFTFSISSSIPLTGAITSSTAEILSASVSYSIAGASTASALGTLSASSTLASISGITSAFTLGAAVSSVGYPISSLYLFSSIDPVTERGTANVSPTGNAASFSPGTLGVASGTNVNLTGNTSAFSVGAETLSYSSFPSLSGISAHAAFGNLLEADATNLAGIIAYTALGTATALAYQSASPLGAAMGSALGLFSYAVSPLVNIQGVSVTTHPGSLLFTSIQPPSISTTFTIGSLSSTESRAIQGNDFVSQLGTLGNVEAVTLAQAGMTAAAYSLSYTLPPAYGVAVGTTIEPFGIENDAALRGNVLNFLAARFNPSYLFTINGAAAQFYLTPITAMQTILQPAEMVTIATDIRHIEMPLD